MKVYGFRIFVDDLAAARSFYADTLGLPVLWEQPDVGAFGVDAGVQLIVEVERDEPELVGRFVGISLQVDDIQAEYDRLVAAGVPFQGPPNRQPWGGTLAHFQDPAGNTLTLFGA